MPVDISREPASLPGGLPLYPFGRTIAFVVGFAGVWATLLFVGQLLG